MPSSKDYAFLGGVGQGMSNLATQMHEREKLRQKLAQEKDIADKKAELDATRRAEDVAHRKSQSAAAQQRHVDNQNRLLQQAATSAANRKVDLGIASKKRAEDVGWRESQADKNAKSESNKALRESQQTVTSAAADLMEKAGTITDADRKAIVSRLERVGSLLLVGVESTQLSEDGKQIIRIGAEGSEEMLPLTAQLLRLESGKRAAASDQKGISATEFKAVSPLLEEHAEALTEDAEPKSGISNFISGIRGKHVKTPAELDEAARAAAEATARAKLYRQKFVEGAEQRAGIAPLGTAGPPPPTAQPAPMAMGDRVDPVSGAIGGLSSAAPPPPPATPQQQSADALVATQGSMPIQQYSAHTNTPLGQVQALDANANGAIDMNEVQRRDKAVTQNAQADIVGLQESLGSGIYTTSDGRKIPIDSIEGLREKILQKIKDLQVAAKPVVK